MKKNVLSLALLTIILMVFVAMIQPIQGASLTSDDWCEIGVPYLAVDGLTVTLNNCTMVEKTGSYQYNITYTLENENLNEKILEGSFKMYYKNTAGGLPQYGFFNYLFPGDTITRSYTFEELKSKPFDVLEYHHDHFFSDEPLEDSLKWKVEIPYDDDVTIHEGNIIVGNNDTFLIENCQFNLTGKLIIKDMAEVIIRNATFISNWNTSEVPVGPFPRETRHVIVEKQAKLTVLNSELIFSTTYPTILPVPRLIHTLVLFDQATVNVTESKVTYANGCGDFIRAYNDSELWIKDVTINGSTAAFCHSGLEASGRSKIDVKNSTINQVDFGENCTVNVSNSNIKYFHIYSNTTTTVNMFNSNIKYWLMWGGTVNIIDSTLLYFTILGAPSSGSNVWLTDTTVKELEAYGSKVWLHNCSIKEPHIHNAKVWVVWDLPFGQVAVPYAWVPYIPPVTLTIILIAVASLFFLIRRKRRLRKGVLIEG